MANASDIQAYWQGRGRHERLVRHDGATRTTEFREHPVWLGVVPLLLTPTPGGRPLRRVADMGSGTGIVAEHLARLGYEVVAIEFAESRAALARERLARYPNAELRVGDAMAPPLDIGEVDAVVSRNLIWLLPDPQAAVMHWRNLVGPGGRIAAVDATARLDRTWVLLARSTLRTLLGRSGTTAHLEKSGVSAAGSPLANVPDLQPVTALWRDAGLVDVSGQYLPWVTAAKNDPKPVAARLNQRSRYFMVTGDAGP